MVPVTMVLATDKYGSTIVHVVQETCIQNISQQNSLSPIFGQIKLSTLYSCFMVSFSK